MDEYIHLTNLNNVKKYLRKNSFKKCNIIYLNNVIHTDNDQLYYYNDSLFKRFPYVNVIANKNDTVLVKMILKGNLSNIRFTNPHILMDSNYSGCNSFGNITEYKDMKYDNDNYYFDHFYFKSSEEYLEKLMRGDALYGAKRGFNSKWFKLYFKYNKATKQKLDYFENKTGFNLTEYRDKT